MLITELGYFALLTAFVLALLQVILPTIGVIRNQVACVNTPFLTQHHRRIIKPPACTQQVSYH